MFFFHYHNVLAKLKVTVHKDHIPGDPEYLSGSFDMKDAVCQFELTHTSLS